MTNSRSRSRDLQDAFERHVWGRLQDIDGAGAKISVRGTGTEDYDAPVMNFGYGFRLPDNANAEVLLVALGSDTNQKVALLTLPRDKQRHWPEGAGGVQHPQNVDIYIELNDNEVILRHGRLRLGNEQQVTVDVSGDNVTLTGNLTVTGTLDVAGGHVRHQGTNIGRTHVHGGVDRGSSNTNGPS